MATPVVYGSKGPLVKEMQKYLASKGFNPGTIDGIWGPTTQKAVDAFKKKGGSMPWADLQKKSGVSTAGGKTAVPAKAGTTTTKGTSAKQDDIINRMLKSEFGPLIKPFAKVDELRSLIINLAPVAWGGKGWSETKFLAAVKGTKWWNKKAEDELSWSTLTTGEKESRIKEMGSQMFDFLRDNAGQDWVVKAGYADMFKKIGQPGGKLRDWAWRVASGQMSFEQWQVSMTQTLLKDTTTEASILSMQRREEMARLAKRPEEMAEEIWQQARGEYFLNLSKPAAKKWADDIIAGKASFGALKDYFRSEASKMYKGYSEAINNGVLPKQLFGPALGMLSQELEMSEEQIIADGTLWGEITAQASGDKGHFTASDWVRYARKHPTYKSTRGARHMAADFSERLLRQFGAVA